jgi:hypothetical protein
MPFILLYTLYKIVEEEKTMWCLINADIGEYDLVDPEANALLARVVDAYRKGDQLAIRKLGGELIRRMVERVDEAWEDPERFSSEPDPYDVWADMQMLELAR